VTCNGTGGEHDERRGGWTVEEFHAELARFEEELKAAGIAPNTVHRYADRSGSRVQHSWKSWSAHAASCWAGNQIGHLALYECSPGLTDRPVVQRPRRRAA
jgi:hypothetical protein